MPNDSVDYDLGAVNSRRRTGAPSTEAITSAGPAPAVATLSPEALTRKAMTREFLSSIGQRHEDASSPSALS
jgi:hypothetical protein